MSEKEYLSKVLAEINTLKEKISILEKENKEINQLLLRKNEKEYKTNSYINEINDIKIRQDQFESSLVQDLTKFKKEIINDINEKHSKLLQNLKENNNLENCDIKQDYINNNNEKDIKNEPKKENEKYLKHNYSRDSIKSALLVQKESLTVQKKTQDDNLNKEFIQYREELNKYDLKLSLLEKKYNSLSTQIFSEIKNINTIIENLKNNDKNNENFKENTIINMKKFKGDFEYNARNNKLFISEVSNIIEDFQKKINTFENNTIKINSNISERNNGLNSILSNLNNVLNDEMNEFHLEINKQIKDQNNEIENFEKFISQEQEKFVEFMQNRFDETISSIKKLFDFNINDIKKLNNKIEIVQENIKKVRIDVFQNINDSEEFLENKCKSLFRLINKE